MGIFSAIKSFLLSTDEPWWNEYRQQEAAQQMQVKAKPQSTIDVDDEDSEEFECGTKYLQEIDDELSRESPTFNPMHDTFNPYRSLGI